MSRTNSKQPSDLTPRRTKDIRYDHTPRSKLGIALLARQVGTPAVYPCVCMSSSCTMKGNRASTGKAQPSIHAFFSSGNLKKNRLSKKDGERHHQARETRGDQQRTNAPKQAGEIQALPPQQTKRDRPEEDDVVVCDVEPSEKRHRPCSAPAPVVRDPMRHELAQRKFAIRRQNLVHDKKSLVPSKGAKFTPLEQQV